MTTLVTAVSMLACTVGVPLPAAKVSKRGNTPYPCMNCGCGCSSAEVCWQNCCCHTQQEKLAWARENGVTPPTFVVAAAKMEQRLAKRDSAGSCCAKAASSCCRAKRSCCQEQPESTKPQQALSGVLAIQALKCHGLGMHWMFVPPSLAPADGWTARDLHLWGSASFTSAAYASYLSQPTTPPPQFA